MPKYEGKRFIFLMIDCATLWLWARVVDSRSKETVARCFDDIFSKWPKCDRLELDRAGEFIALSKQHFFERNGIYVHFKKPPLKAPFIGK